MKKFTLKKDDARIKSLKDDAKKAGIKDDARIFKPVGAANIVPESGKFGVAYVKDLKPAKTNEPNMSHVRLPILNDAGDVVGDVSLSALTALGYKGDVSNISFKPSRKTSQLKGKGVLANTEQISPKINRALSLSGLDQASFAVALEGVKFTAEPVEYVTYFPTVEKLDDAPSHEELNAIEDKLSIEGVVIKNGFEVTLEA